MLSEDPLASFEAAETYLVDWLLWPSWALRTIFTLSILTTITLIFEYIWSNGGFSGTFGKGSTDSTDSATRIPKGFRWFQFQYLTVYLTIMLADWLQGTNMYTLYDGYGVDIGSLFLTGFASSALFGTFLGIYVDRYGRRWGCIVFCVLEVIINLFEHVNNFPLLLIGRVLGGLTTSLLFSSFESWMVTEHRKRGFPEELLAHTFSFAAAGNGISAIAAGIIAQIASDYSGDIGPFQLAILLTVITLGMILFWRENKGEIDDSIEKDGGLGGHIIGGMRNAGRTIWKSPEMMCLGLSQSFYEGAVYTFVFMWVPNMMIVSETKNVPTGLIFSCFMLAMTLGGTLSGILLELTPGGAGSVCLLTYLIAACSMAVPIISYEFWPVFISFLVLEFSLGIFNAGGGTLRSKYYPMKLQSSIMNVFRIPLNALVVVGTKLTSWAGTDVGTLQMVFGVVVLMHLTAFGFQLYLSCCLNGGIWGKSKAKAKAASAAKKKDDDLVLEDDDTVEVTKKPSAAKTTSTTSKPKSSSNAKTKSKSRSRGRASSQAKSPAGRSPSGAKSRSPKKKPDTAGRGSTPMARKKN